MRIAANANSVSGIQNVAVREPIAPVDALKRLLSGTGLSARSLDNSHIVVTKTLVSQNAIDDELFGLGTIVLRGGLIERDLQDSPTSATVVSGDQLTQHGDDNIFDLADRASNVVSTGSEESIAIRGVTQFGTGRGTSGPLFSTQVDGVALPDVSAIGRTAIPTWDVEQVEILKRPQSTQQGRNSLGGAVVVRTRDPEYDNEYRFQAGICIEPGSDR